MLIISTLLASQIFVKLSTCLEISTPTEFTLLSSILPDHTIRSIPDYKNCVTTTYANSGNNFLELVPCSPYGGEEIITEDMLFKYDNEDNSIKSLIDEQCWNVNQMKLTLSLKMCRSKVRSTESKQAFHVMRNGTTGAFVPGGQYAGMCIGYAVKNQQFKKGMKLIGLFDCNMQGYNLEF